MNKREINIMAFCRLVLLFVCLAVLAFPLFSQPAKAGNKIDPILNTIIARSQLRDCPYNVKSSATKGKTKKSTALKKVTAEQFYDCIVYTKSAGRLRAKGIVVNSELPTFVTASVTLCQVLQLAAMSEVSYIEASEKVSLHK